MKKICVTGGAGFIASHVVDHLTRTYPDAEIICVDKMCYPARREYLYGAFKTGRVRLIEKSICDTEAMKLALKNVDLVVHAAAESHVDNSYKDVSPFIDSNINGTISMLNASVHNEVGMFLHVSTDEVYGESSDRDFTDEEPLNPMNPYAASKASAEMFVKSYVSSFGLRARVSRANNIYGTRQYPEKLIPKLICDAHRGAQFQVHGQGTAIRSFLHVTDYCKALSTIIHHGEDGEIYNVPALNEYTVMDVVELVSQAMDIPVSEFVTMGPDRPHNDCRYGVCGKKLLSLGWFPKRSLEQDLKEMVNWYHDNLHLYYDDKREVAKPGKVSLLNRTLFRRSNLATAQDYSFAEASPLADFKPRR